MFGLSTPEAPADAPAAPPGFALARKNANLKLNLVYPGDPVCEAMQIIVMDPARGTVTTYTTAIAEFRQMVREADHHWIGDMRREWFSQGVEHGRREAKYEADERARRLRWKKRKAAAKKGRRRK